MHVTELPMRSRVYCGPGKQGEKFKHRQEGSVFRQELGSEDFRCTGKDCHGNSNHLVVNTFKDISIPTSNQPCSWEVARAKTLAHETLPFKPRGKCHRLSD